MCFFKGLSPQNDSQRYYLTIDLSDARSLAGMAMWPGRGPDFLGVPCGNFFAPFAVKTFLPEVSFTAKPKTALLSTA
jgi:hypothetical protein